jgi:cellulose biosynthesis protein BcsQ
MSTSDLVQLAGAIGGLLCAIVGITMWLLRRYIKELQLTIKNLKVKLKRLRRKMKRLTKAEAKARQERDRDRQEAETAQRQLEATRTDLTQAQQESRRTREVAEGLQRALEERVELHNKEVQARDEQIKQLAKERDGEHESATQAKIEAAHLTSQLDQLNDQIEQVIKQDERVWERPVNGLPFQPLSQREVPIIAVLNLKGGVGKTTITANLAGLMAERGKKVLVIDADYQRNLSMLLVPDKDRKMLHLERRTLQHFLSDPSQSLTSLLYAASEVTGLSGCWVVTNSDALKPPMTLTTPALEDIGLEDVEMRLMAEWMFRPAGLDVRLRLRKALHDLHLKQKGYHYVLIDCPPRLSTACINALAASDFFLVPVLLDAVSARSVPNLLRTLRRLRSDTLLPHLCCLGVVANDITVRTGKPIAQEAKIWGELPTACRVAWERNIPLFETMIPHSNLLRKAAGALLGAAPALALALADDEINRVFTALLQEIEMRVEHERKLLAAVPPQPALSVLGG